MTIIRKYQEKWIPYFLYFHLCISRPLFTLTSDWCFEYLNVCRNFLWVDEWIITSPRLLKAIVFNISVLMPYHWFHGLSFQGISCNLKIVIASNLWYLQGASFWEPFFKGLVLETPKIHIAVPKWARSEVARKSLKIARTKIHQSLPLQINQWQLSIMWFKCDKEPADFITRLRLEVCSWKVMKSINHYDEQPQLSLQQQRGFSYEMKNVKA